MFTYSQIIVLYLSVAPFHPRKLHSVLENFILSHRTPFHPEWFHSIPKNIVYPAEYRPFQRILSIPENIVHHSGMFKDTYCSDLIKKTQRKLTAVYNLFVIKCHLNLRLFSFSFQEEFFVGRNVFINSTYVDSIFQVFNKTW